MYATLVPFNFSFSFELLMYNWANIEWIEKHGQYFYTTRNVDAIVNILIYIPLGIIIFNTRYALGRRERSTLDIALAMFFGLLLSAFVELLQLLIKERTTSFVDIIMNTLGCFAGGFIAYSISYIFSNSNRMKMIHIFMISQEMDIMVKILDYYAGLDEILNTFFTI